MRVNLRYQQARAHRGTALALQGNAAARFHWEKALDLCRGLELTAEADEIAAVLNAGLTTQNCYCTRMSCPDPRSDSGRGPK